MPDCWRSHWGALRARGMSEIGKAPGITREALYMALRCNKLYA
jgi:DNA-binding phage protein